MKLTKQSMAALAVAAPTLASPVPDIFDPLKCWLNPVFGHLKYCPAATPFCSSILHITTVTKSEGVTVTQPITTTVAVPTGTHIITPPAVTSYSTITTTYDVCKTPAAKRDYYPPPSYPTPTLPCGISPALTSYIPGACSCLNLHTPTTTICTTATAHPTVTVTTSVEATITEIPSTVMSTVTVTYTPTGRPIPTACGNAGIEWAYYTNPSGPDGNYLPEKEKTVTPSHQGTDDNVATFYTPNGAAPVVIHGQSLSPTYLDLAHRFYLYAPISGTYTFRAYNVDDSSYLWVGDKAYSGWTKANADSHAAWTPGPGNGDVRFGICLEEGNYYPVRVIFGQGGGPGSFKFSVTGPDGTVLLSPDVKSAPIFFTHACPDAGEAPAFPPFGQET